MAKKKKAMTGSELEKKHAHLIKEYLSGQKTRYKTRKSTEEVTTKLPKKRKIKQKVTKLTDYEGMRSTKKPSKLTKKASLKSLP